MNESNLTLRQYLENYTKVRQEKDGTLSKAVGVEKNVKTIENHVNFIKQVLDSKVSEATYKHVVNHLDQIQELVRISVNQLINQNQSQVRIVSTTERQEKNKQKTSKRLLNKDNKNSLEIKLSLKMQNIKQNTDYIAEKWDEQMSTNQTAFFKKQNKENLCIQKKKVKVEFLPQLLRSQSDFELKMTGESNFSKST